MDAVEIGFDRRKSGWVSVTNVYFSIEGRNGQSFIILVHAEKKPRRSLSKVPWCEYTYKIPAIGFRPAIWEVL